MDENISKQILAMGFPSARIMLLALAKYYNKEYLNNEIEEICHIQEIGCLNVDYFNTVSNEKDNILIFLKECDKDHDLSIQLDKLKNHLTEDKWKEVLKSLSAIILFARKIYTSIYVNNLELIRKIVNDENINKYNTLFIDPINTTLYLPNLDDRIGIFFENN